MFPPELWHLVSRSTTWDTQSLRTLSHSSSLLRNVFRPLLYHQVHLPSASAVSSFCESVELEPDVLAPHVHSLLIDRHLHPCYSPVCSDFEPIDLSRESALMLQSLLEHLANLRELRLSVSPHTLNICLTDLQVPFHLDRLAIPLVSFKSVKQFVTAQSSVTELQVVPYVKDKNLGQPCGAVWLSANHQVLPNVHTITAPVLTLAQLCIGRLFPRVTVVLGDEGHDTPDHTLRMNALGLVLSASHVTSLRLSRCRSEPNEQWQDTDTWTNQPNSCCMVKDIPIIPYDATDEQLSPLVRTLGQRRFDIRKPHTPLETIQFITVSVPSGSVRGMPVRWLTWAPTSSPRPGYDLKGVLDMIREVLRALTGHGDGIATI